MREVCLTSMCCQFSDLLPEVLLLHIHMHSDISIAAMKYVCRMKQTAIAALSHSASLGREVKESFLKSLECFRTAFVSESCGAAK